MTIVTAEYDDRLPVRLSTERALRTRYWDTLRARRRALPEMIDLDARRGERERAWRAWTETRMAERERNDEIWSEMLQLRQREAGDDGYLAHRWRQLGRTDYLLDDIQRFHYAIEEWVSPVLLRIHEERRVRLGLKTLRPWDVALKSGLGAHGPAEGQEASLLSAAGKRPESRSLIRSAYELTTAIETEQRAALLERFLVRWAQAAMIDSFEVWAYTHPGKAAGPDACAERWRAGWLLFLPGIDWSGLDVELGCEWHDQWPIYVAPFHAIEPAIGQLAAVQIWASHQRDAAATVDVLADAAGASSVRSALLTVGLESAIDDHAVREAVDALEKV